ncbi:MAG: hypothetical protein GYA21_04855 [Myxococcales bacterium]|nr:hypothetical protein [Myxococcales bacterium]
MRTVLVTMALAFCIFSSCVPVHRVVGPTMIMLPEVPEGRYLFFSDGIPYAVSDNTCSTLMSSMGFDYVAGYKYIKVYLAYRNTTEKEVLFYPGKTMRIIPRGIKGADKPILPDSPSTLAASVETSAAMTKAAIATFGWAQTMYLAPTVASTTDGKTILINNKTQQQLEVMRDTRDQIATVDRYAHEAVAHVSSSTLKRNTVFPGQTVSGFVFFPFPFNIPLENERRRGCSIQLEIETPCGMTTIVYNPADGE